MARMSIFNPNMAKLLPKFMKADETDVALSRAMDVLLAEPANRAKILRKWDQIDNMNDAQLDEMAWEFNIDWWDSSFSLETKRSVIRTCYRVHEKRGTKWAVEELITSAFGMGKVTEWFEYGGDPYKFRVVIGATEAGITADRQAAVLDRVRFYKNLRSHLEAISYQIEKRTAVKVAAVHAIGQRVEVYPYLARNMESHGGFYCGGYTQYGRKLAVFPNK